MNSLWKAKRAPTAKQLEALAKGRAYRQQNIMHRYALEAESRYIKTKEYTEDFSAEKYINRLKYSSEEKGITYKQAHVALMHTFPYTSRSDNYKYQIFQHVDWNELKRRVAEATGSKYTTVTKEGSTKLGQVRVMGMTKEEIENSFFENLPFWTGIFINQETGAQTVINLRIVEGTGSDNPNFVEIS